MLPRICACIGKKSRYKIVYNLNRNKTILQKRIRKYRVQDVGYFIKPPVC